MASTSLARNDFWILGISPSNVTLMPSTLMRVGSWYSSARSSSGVNSRMGLSAGNRPLARKIRPYQPSIV